MYRDLNEMKVVIIYLICIDMISDKIIFVRAYIFVKNAYLQIQHSLHCWYSGVVITHQLKPDQSSALPKVVI